MLSCGAPLELFSRWKASCQFVSGSFLPSCSACSGQKPWFISLISKQGPMTQRAEKHILPVTFESQWASALFDILHQQAAIKKKKRALRKSSLWVFMFSRRLLHGNRPATQAQPTGLKSFCRRTAQLLPHFASWTVEVVFEFWRCWWIKNMPRFSTPWMLIQITFRHFCNFKFASGKDVCSCTVNPSCSSPKVKKKNVFFLNRYEFGSNL